MESETLQKIYGTKTFRLAPKCLHNGELSEQEKMLARHAGASRCVWNEAIAYINDLKKPSDNEGADIGEAAQATTTAEARQPKHPSWQDLFKRFSEMRNDKDGDWAWLNELDSHIVRNSLKRLSDTYKKAFKNSKNKVANGRQSKNPYGFPQFHRWTPNTSFTVPDTVCIKDGKLCLPKKAGGEITIRPRKKGEKECAKTNTSKKEYDIPGKIKYAVIKREAGKWYACLTYEITAEQVSHESDNAIGIDLNANNETTYTTSEGKYHHLPKRLHRRQKRLNRMRAKLSLKNSAALHKLAGWDGKSETRKAAEVELKKQHLKRSDENKESFAGHRYSRRYDKLKNQISRVSRKIKAGRFEYLHGLSKEITDNNKIICYEDLNVTDMTKNAKGTVEEPGVNVKAKSGLNREILNKGWYQFRQMLEYKAKRKGGITVAVPPQYTSQQCSECEHINKENRKTQAKFKCVECNYTENADINAAKNILIKGLSQVRGQSAGKSANARKSAGSKRTRSFVNRPNFIANEGSDTGYNCALRQETET